LAELSALFDPILPVQALRGTSEAIASLQRLEKFLLLEEAKDHEQSKVGVVQKVSRVCMHLWQKACDPAYHHIIMSLQLLWHVAEPVQEYYSPWY
jgi:hypothetical protein